MEISDEIKQKIATTIVAAAAAFIVSKTVDVAWKLITGDTPPSEEDPNQGTVKLVVFAGVTAMAAALARQLAVKKTQSYIAAHPFSK